MELEEPDLATLQWLLPEFSQAFGPLNTPALALDYFSQSPFWDAQSNNGTLRTQFRLQPDFNYERELQLLQDMSGTEFAVVHADPPSLFIIHKREGDRGPKSRVLASYVMLDSVIYQSPSVYEYASTKLLNAVHLISQSLETLQSKYPPMEPRSTQLWQSLPPAPPPAFEKQKQSEDQPTSAGVKPAEAGTSTSKAQETRHNPLLLSALFTADSAMADLDSISAVPPSKVVPSLPQHQGSKKAKRTVVWSTSANGVLPTSVATMQAPGVAGSPWTGEVDVSEQTGSKRKAAWTDGTER